MKINNDSEVAKIISKNLHEFNKEHCEYIRLNSDGEETKSEKCNFIVYDNNETIGGGQGHWNFTN